MIRRKAEDCVSKQGRSTVTLKDIEELRKKTMAGSVEIQPENESNDELSGDGMTAKQIEKVIENAKVQIVSSSRFYEVKVCGGAFGCPRSLSDVRMLAEKMINVIEETGVPGAVEKRTKGPVLKHHRYSVSISGCPNSCSQPQIVDFGVQSRARPAVGKEVCDGCEACVSVCRENAIAVTDNIPIFDQSNCIDCGDCGAVCPTQAIVTKSYGYSVLIGGKLGRHPQLAMVLHEYTDEEILLASLEIACEIFISEMHAGERFADTVVRIGIDEILRRIDWR